ncbi:MAG: methylated-DNA--[protein]-cysteine S-methyltransferase [Enterococcus sp.]
MEQLYFATAEYQATSYLVISSHKGVVYLGVKEQAQVEIEKYFKQIHLIEDERTNRFALQQLTEYFSGKRQVFDCPLDLRGTAFQKRVWQELLKVPFGQTSTYSELAENIGQLKGVRAVANAVGRNPVMIITPCHRIIGKNGRLTGYRGGLSLKRRLLELEGIDTQKM